MPDASQRLVTWCCGVLGQDDRPGLEVRVAQELADESGWSDRIARDSRVMTKTSPARR
jgi:hypothetical protein